MERLQSEEDLRAVQVHMIGAGTFRSDSERRRAIDALTKSTKPKARYDRQTPKAELLARFAAMGFRVAKQTK